MLNKIILLSLLIIPEIITSVSIFAQAIILSNYPRFA